MKKLIAISNKEEGKTFIIPKWYQQQLDKLPQGKYQCIVEKYHRKATHQQFKYLFGVVYPNSLIALNGAGYEFTTIDEVNDFWVNLFCSHEVLNRETGEIMRLPMSKAEFDTLDEMTFCNAIRNYVSDYLGMSIPDPDPNYNLKEIDAELHSPLP